MNRPGYVLAELGAPANEPSWAQGENGEPGLQTRTMQATMDRAFLNSLDNFYGQGDGYVQTQTVLRANSPDPKNFTPAPFTIAIPRRQLVAYNENGELVPDVFAPVDPSIKMPELPAYVDPGPVGGRGFQMATPPDQVILAKLAAMDAKLDRLLAK